MKLRMYFFVPYNISEIQKGIQAGHCAVEYARKYGGTELFKDFATKNKTWIILNGGTTRFSNSEWDEDGDINNIAKTLKEENIIHTIFCEPDLNYALSAVCFIADERVWDFETYPDLEIPTEFTVTHCRIQSQKYYAWVKSIGGDKNRILRDLIRGKKLA